MTTLEIAKIIKDYGLNCTVQEFKNYYDNLQIDTTELENVQASIHTFDEPYNNIQIKNPANGKYYYVLSILGKTFLQNHSPFEQGYVPLNDDNVHDIIERHKRMIIDRYVNSQKLEKTIEYFLK